MISKSHSECPNIDELLTHKQGSIFLASTDIPSLYELHEELHEPNFSLKELIKDFFWSYLFRSHGRSKDFRAYQEWLFDRVLACDGVYIALPKDRYINIDREWPTPVGEQTWAIRDKPRTFWNQFYRDGFLSHQGDWILYQRIDGVPISASRLDEALTWKEGDDVRVVQTLREIKVQFLIFSYPDDDRWLLFMPPP